MHAQSIVGFLLLAAAPLVLSADIENGEALHNENCIKCHQPELYTGTKSKITSLASLKSRVQFCEISNELTWFEEEVDDVVEYLNVNFYQFNMK